MIGSLQTETLMPNQRRTHLQVLVVLQHLTVTARPTFAHYSIRLNGRFTENEQQTDLQVLVVLQHLLHATGHGVVVRAQDAGVQHARGGVQGVHGGVDAQLWGAQE